MPLMYFGLRRAVTRPYYSLHNAGKRELAVRASDIRSTPLLTTKFKEEIMKKLLLSASLLGAIAIIAPSAAEAKTTTNAVSAPQIRVQIGNNNRRNRRVRVVTTTRMNGRYRETIQTRYLPNGRTVTRVVSRVLVNNGWRNNNWRRRG